MKRGFTVLEAFVVMIIIIVVFFVGITVLDRIREQAREARCTSNFQRIGIGLINYARENAEMLPVIPCDFSDGNETRIIGTDINRKRSGRDGQSPWRYIQDPYAKDSQGKFLAPVTTPTISASLWLLCRSNRVSPGVFLCPGIPFKCIEEDTLADTTGKISEPGSFSDFYTSSLPNEPLIDYSFRLPYGPGWTIRATPETIVGADANNGQNSSIDGIGKANSWNHSLKGQNILRIDGSAGFTKIPYAGKDGDNIYTALPEGSKGETSKVPGVLRVRPRDERDTVLVPVQEEKLAGWDRKP